MDVRLVRLLQQFENVRGVEDQAIQDLITHISVALPADYLEFLRHSNGAVSNGPNLFVTLWPVEEIVELTKGYGAPEYAPGMIVIGSDGCGNLIGIDTRSNLPDKMEYVWLDSISMGWEEIIYKADSLASLLAYLDIYYANAIRSINR